MSNTPGERDTPGTKCPQAAMRAFREYGIAQCRGADYPAGGVISGNGDNRLEGFISVIMTDAELQLRIRRKESFLVGADGQFLGQLSSNRFMSESVMNEYGSYGSQYSSTSIFNLYGSYGSEYSSLSPFNQYTSTPPSIYLRGVFAGYLTVNQYTNNRLDPHQLFDYINNNGL